MPNGNGNGRSGGTTILTRRPTQFIQFIRGDSGKGHDCSRQLDQAQPATCSVRLQRRDCGSTSTRNDNVVEITHDMGHKTRDKGHKTCKNSTIA